MIEPWPRFNECVALAEGAVTKRWTSWGAGLLPALQATADGDRQAYYRLLCRALELSESTLADTTRAVIEMYKPHGEELVTELVTVYGAEPLRLYAVMRQALVEPAHIRLGFMLQLSADKDTSVSGWRSPSVGETC